MPNIDLFWIGFVVVLVGGPALGYVTRGRLTRTQWLIVLGLGLLALIGGVAIAEPTFAVPGVFATLAAVVGAIGTPRKS